jgi:23S rRNA pseudouridine1911/1915/1917 synthase
MTELDDQTPARQARATAGRLDTWLSHEWPELSRSRWQGLVRDGWVSVDGELTDKPGRRLSGGERVVARVPAVRPSELAPSDMSLQIVFEDADLLIADKPAGVVVHPSAGHELDTLVQAVLRHAPDLPGVGGERRPGVVHRLDKDTSGLVVFAKNERAMAELQRQFKARLVHKTYLAIVHGSPPTEDGLIDAAVGRDPRERKRMAVVSESKGRSARTRFHILSRMGDFSLLAVEPETGRTHQIRVHLAYLGVPVAGDRVYGSRHQPDWLSRQMLHAWRLGIRRPSGTEAEVFEAPVPQDFRDALGRSGDSVDAEAAIAAIGRTEC